MYNKRLALLYRIGIGVFISLFVLASAITTTTSAQQTSGGSGSGSGGTSGGSGGTGGSGQTSGGPASYGSKPGQVVVRLASSADLAAVAQQYGLDPVPIDQFRSQPIYLLGI